MPTLRMSARATRLGITMISSTFLVPSSIPDWSAISCGASRCGWLGVVLDNCYYKAAGSSGRDRWRLAMAVYMHIGTKEAGEMINDLIQRVRGRAKNEQNPAVQLYYFFPYIQYIWFGVKFFIILLTPTSISTHLLHPTLYWLGRCTFILLHCMHRSRSRCWKL